MIMILVAFLATVLCAIAVIDAREQRIPDVLSLPLIPVGLLLSDGSFPASLDGGFVVPPDRLAAMLLLGSALFGVARAHVLLRGSPGLGMGDVKLAMAAAAWILPAHLPLWLFVSAASALVFAVSRGIGLRQRLPFGSFMAPWFWAFYAFRIADFQ